MDSPGVLLIVDDEAPVRRLLRRFFEMENYRVLEASNAAEALSSLESNDIDLMTLDLNLGGEDGLNLARQVKAVSSVAIVMVSGKGDLIDKVVGLEVGADDYIAKPFELREVLARVRSVLRRTKGERVTKKSADIDRDPASSTADRVNVSTAESPSSAMTANDMESGEALDVCYRFAGCSVDVAAREFRDKDGRPCDLTTAEFDLLHLFLRSGRQALTRDRIMDALKGTDWHPNDRTIDNHIARLRRKLNSAGVERAIRTVRGIGYQFSEKATRENEL